LSVTLGKAALPNKRLLQSPVDGLAFLRFAQHSSGAAESRDVRLKLQLRWRLLAPQRYPYDITYV